MQFTARVGAEEVEVVVDDSGVPFRTAADGNALDSDSLSRNYQLQRMVSAVAGDAYSTQEIWAYPPAVRSRLKLAGQFMTYSLADRARNESYAPTLDHQWALRQIAWQRELVSDIPPPIPSDVDSCDEVLQKVPSADAVGMGSQTIVVGIGASTDAEITGVRLNVEGVTDGKLNSAEATELTAQTLRTLRAAPPRTTTSLLVSQLAQAHYRVGSRIRAQEAFVLATDNFPFYKILLVGVQNSRTGPQSLVSYTLDIGVRDGGRQAEILHIDDAGQPFRQGSLDKLGLGVGTIVTFCPTPSSAPAWAIRPGSEYIDGASLPCLAPKSPTRPN